MWCFPALVHKPVQPLRSLAEQVCCSLQATLKFIEMKLRAPADNGKPGKGALTMESKAVIIRVLQRFQANVPQELRSEVAIVTRLALTGHSGRFPEDIETEASDKYKEASHLLSCIDAVCCLCTSSDQAFVPHDRRIYSMWLLQLRQVLSQHAAAAVGCLVAHAPCTQGRIVLVIWH